VREDTQLLGKVRSEKYKEVDEPSADEIQAYFAEHEEQFADSASLKVEQVWCADLPTAEKAKQMFADGASLESVNAAHGLLEQSRPHNVYPSSEGLFWEDLWKAEPNDVVGPLKGFYQTGIKWRVVRVLEKTPPVPRPYSDALKNQVKSALMTSRRQDIMDTYEAQLLETYPSEIYADRIEDIDPLEVTPQEEQTR
ncbi:MAG: peptidyl-prolyl cis-trans isomerase, partial [Planctomycetota bacterium]